MMISINRRIWDGTCVDRYRSEDLGLLGNELLKHYDTRVSDLFASALEIIYYSGTNTRQDLFNLEMKRSTGNNMLAEYSGDIGHGAVLPVEQIRECIFRDLWMSYLFMECTDMSSDLIQIFRKGEKTTDVDELLFWTFRFCAWGGHYNKLPYTLFLKLVDGSFERFYGSCPEWFNLLRESYEDSFG